MKLRPQKSVLGLFIEPDEVVVCRLRRRGAQVEVAANARIPVAASLLKSDPERAGHQLRAGMQSLRIGRFERCVVCLPLNWAFTFPLELPDLSEADMQNFVRLEAERRFPLAPEDLTLTVAHRHSVDGTQRAVLVGVSTAVLSSIGTALRAARLHPASITIGMAALADEPPKKHGVLIYLGSGFVDLAVVGDGFLFALRNLIWQEGLTEANLQETVREVSRQLRITLAQFPRERRESIDSAVAHASPTWPVETLSQVAEALSDQGLSFEEGLDAGMATGKDVPPALFAGAARYLRGLAPSVELIPKHAPRMQSVAARLSKRHVRWAIGIASGVLILLAASFGYQDRQLADLEDQWSQMTPRVGAAKAIQDRVREYRPWYDESVPSLAIPKTLAQAFPEAGSVSLKSLHVKDRQQATCSGIASNFGDLMQVKESLGKSGDLDDLKLFSARGGTPVAFTLTFRWKGRKSSGQ